MYSRMGVRYRGQVPQTAARVAPWPVHVRTSPRRSMTTSLTDGAKPGIGRREPFAEVAGLRAVGVEMGPRRRRVWTVRASLYREVVGTFAQHELSRG